MCNSARPFTDEYSKYALVPSETKLRQGNVFTPVCHSVYRGRGCLADTPWAHTRPPGRHPLAEPPLRADTPPSRWLLQRTVRILLERILVLWKLMPLCGDVER